MSMSEAYDEILEDMECPECGTIGMMPNGTGWYDCPNCGHEGTIPEWK